MSIVTSLSGSVVESAALALLESVGCVTLLPG